MKRAKDKYLVGINTVKIGYYADSIPNFYYSMLFAATALLTMKNKQPKTHDGTITSFGQEFIRDDDFNREIAKYFAQTETLRDKVDYDAFNGVTENMANKRMNQCKEFLKETNRIFEKHHKEEYTIEL